MLRRSLKPEDIAVVGFHGQTVIHRPADKLTVQIGDGAALAKRLRIPVVHDFRQADIMAGGQGAAPLVPVFHRAIAQTVSRPHPIVVLNIGGVANITFVDGGPDPIACDTGPGNALIDDFMRARTGAPYDDNGDAAAGGTPNRDFIARVLDNPFFDLKPPKSLDRNAFAFANIGLPEFSVADGAATLSALTVAADCARGAASAGAAARVDRRRRRSAQPHADEDAGRDACSGDGRDRGSGRVVGRRARSAGPSPSSRSARCADCRSRSRRRAVRRVRYRAA